MKKILLVNLQSMYDKNATGITLRSIFEDIDDYEIMDVYYYQNDRIDKEKYCSVKLNKWIKPIDVLFRVFHSGKVKKNINKQLVFEEIYSKDKPNRILKLKELRQWVLGLSDFSQVFMRCANKEIKTIDGFKPDVIYTLGASTTSLVISNYFADRYSIPVVVHHMDNWRESKYSSKSQIFFRKKMQKKLNVVEEKMQLGLTISQAMARHYSNTYGREFIPLMNTVSKINEPEIMQRISRDEEFKFVYAGGLHLGRWETLKKLEIALRDIEDIENIKLLIYTSDENKLKYQSEFDNQITLFKDFVEHDKVNTIYENADILVHVESFDEEYIEFTKYSISTKIPEYLNSGKMIMAIGPNELASIKYIKDNNIGYFAEKTHLIKETLNNIMNDYGTEEFQLVLENAYNQVVNFHSREYKKEVLEKIFEERDV